MTSFFTPGAGDPNSVGDYAAELATILSRRPANVMTNPVLAALPPIDTTMPQGGGGLSEEQIEDQEDAATINAIAGAIGGIAGAYGGASGSAAGVSPAVTSAASQPMGATGPTYGALTGAGAQPKTTISPQGSIPGSLGQQVGMSDPVLQGLPADRTPGTTYMKTTNPAFQPQANPTPSPPPTSTAPEGSSLLKTPYIASILLGPEYSWYGAARR